MRRRHILLLLIAFPAILVFLPAALVMYVSPGKPETPAAPPAAEQQSAADEVEIRVYRTETKKVDTIPLETYIEGVVAAEMPAQFEIEALKAQALAARTYMIRRLQAGDFSDVPEGAHVLDTVQHQAYLDEQQRREKWGNQFAWKNQRIEQAVRETSGLVLTYDGKPIDATFFAVSNGFTENAEEYWSQPIPYLRSVASPWDRESPRFEERTVIPASEFARKLGINLDAETSSGGGWYTILERTTGNRVGRIRVGDKVFTGREFRERLGLNSSAFSLEMDSGQIVITTRGYGHGVGMSQWGANGMAKAGKNAEEIVKYFYRGVTLENYRRFVSA